MLAEGEECTLYYDTTLTVHDGDVVRTSTGRRYLVVHARKSPTKRQRWYLDVIVMGENQINPIGVQTHELHWYKRERAA